jgi:CBS domain containing-hemolysin-like protein
MINVKSINRVRMTMSQRRSTNSVPARIGLRLASVAALLAAMPAHASFMQGETLAKAANVLAIVVLVLVPVIGITVFWLVHILPEKIAHKRNHPQTEAIQVLCLLSLVFGGMLWPIAWLWAYSKPVLYKMAYGTDKLEHHGATATTTTAVGPVSLSDDVAQLRADVDQLVSKGAAPAELASIRDRLAALEPRLAARTEGAR